MLLALKFDPQELVKETNIVVGNRENGDQKTRRKNDLIGDMHSTNRWRTHLHVIHFEFSDDLDGDLAGITL